MNPSLMTAWMVELVIISYRAVKTNSGAGGVISPRTGKPANTPLPLPLPSEYLSTFIVYGALGLLPGRAARPAALIGWGFVVATLLNLWKPGSRNSKAAVTLSQSAANQASTTNVDTGAAQAGK